MADYIDDPTLKRNQVDGRHVIVGGPPPEGHPRQCHGTQNGRRCRQWALRESDRCNFCESRCTGWKKRQVSNATRGNFNRRFASKKLADLLDEAAQDTNRYSLDNELAILRIQQREAQVVWDQLCVECAYDSKVGDGTNGSITQEALNSLKQIASRTLKEAMQATAEMTDKALKAEKEARELEPIPNLQYFTSQLAVVLERNLESHPEIFKQIMEDLKHVRVLDNPKTTRVLLTVEQ